MSSAYKIWRLGEYTEARRGEKATQQIDHIWTGRPTLAQTAGNSDHYSKIAIYGKDCVSVAEKIVRMLNEADASERQPDRSPQADHDRGLIRKAQAGMGSMGVAGLYHILGLGYGAEGFDAALRDASRSQLDRLLACITR